MARLIARLVRAMLALGTPWGLWVALPETHSPFASRLIAETEVALDDFWRAANALMLASLPADEPLWSERSQRRSWARFYPFIPPTEG